jgi:hypothetical protein
LSFPAVSLVVVQPVISFPMAVREDLHLAIEKEEVPLQRGQAMTSVSARVHEVFYLDLPKYPQRSRTWSEY